MKILILGIGNAQVDILEYCKAKGCQVISCSYDEVGRGRAISDEFFVCDIKDAQTIQRQVEKLGIDLVYSIGSDLAMPTVNQVSEALNLKHFVSSRTAMICNNKNQLREKLGADFPANVKSRFMQKPAEIASWSIYPAVLKPSDSQGQRGVYQVGNPQELSERFDSALRFSNSKSVIVEEYIAGEEISVNAYMVEKKVVFAMLSDRISFKEFPGGIIKEHILPSRYSQDPQVLEKVLQVVRQVVEKLEIWNGPVYFQLKITRDLEVKLIEVTPRLDGCHMWRFIKTYCGVDLLDATLRHLFGETILPEQLIAHTQPGSFKLAFICAKPGTVVARAEYTIPAQALYQEWYYSDGEQVKSMNSYMEKIGYYIIKS